MRNGLVGWWKFDETTGTSVQDSSGNGNAGTLTNGSTWGANCKRSQCVQVDGTDDYVTMGDVATHEFASGQSFSLSAWFYPTALPASDTGVITKGHSSATTGSNARPWYLIRFRAAGILNFYLRTSANNDAFTTSSALSLNQWYHIAAVYDATAATTVMYINAIAGTSSTSVVPDAYGTNTGQLVIGQHGGNSFSGSIDDVRIYNRALTAQEVKDLYQPGIMLRNGVVRNGRINK